MQKLILGATLLGHPKPPATSTPIQRTPIAQQMPSEEASNPADTIPVNVNPAQQDFGPGAEGRSSETEDQLNNGSQGPDDCTDSGGGRSAPNTDQSTFLSRYPQPSIPPKGTQQLPGKNGIRGSSNYSSTQAARWNTWQTQQDWQYQMALAQDATTAHLENVNTFSQDYVTLLETGQMSYAQCGTDAACVQAVDAHGGELMSHQTHHSVLPAPDAVGWEAAAEEIGEAVALAIA